MSAMAPPRARQLGSVLEALEGRDFPVLGDGVRLRSEGVDGAAHGHEQAALQRTKEALHGCGGPLRGALLLEGRIEQAALLDKLQELHDGRIPLSQQAKYGAVSYVETPLLLRSFPIIVLGFVREHFRRLV